MYVVDLTLATPAENLALDEALLESAEAGEMSTEVLRLWEALQPCVIIGRSSRLADEARVETCGERGIPILRRTSGGAAIVAGPGCLMYAVVLSYERRPELRMLDEAHRQVLGVVSNALAGLLPGVTCAGTSDLVFGGRKFSGNSVRCKRTHLLYHGTLLYDFPLNLIGECLKSPPRQPDYRAKRDHDAFVCNLPLTSAEMRTALIHGWQANEPLADPPLGLASKLAAERYSQAAWNERL